MNLKKHSLSPDFCYELLIFSLNDLRKNYANNLNLFNHNDIFDFIGSFWLRKTAILISLGKHKYLRINSFNHRNFVKDYCKFFTKAFLKQLVIQNAFVILLKLSLLKRSSFKKDFIPIEGVDFSK